MDKIDKGRRRPVAKAAMTRSEAERQIAREVTREGIGAVATALSDDKGEYSFEEWWRKFIAIRSEVRAVTSAAVYKQNMCRIFQSLAQDKLVTIQASVWEDGRPIAHGETHTGYVFSITQVPQGTAVRFKHIPQMEWVIDCYDPLSVKRAEP